MAGFNYTDEQRASVIAGYDPEASQAARDAYVQRTADELGASVPSVRGVLSRAEVYVAKVTVGKDGKPAVRKESLVKFIRIMLGAQDGELDSFVNATKADLQVMADRLNALNDEFQAD